MLLIYVRVGRGGEGSADLKRTAGGVLNVGVGRGSVHAAAEGEGILSAVSFLLEEVRLNVHRLPKERLEIQTMGRRGP